MFYAAKQNCQFLLLVVAEEGNGHRTEGYRTEGYYLRTVGDTSSEHTIQ